MRTTKRDVNLFFGLLVFSLIGNACADYALLWHGIEQLSSGSRASKTGDLSAFYIGQAIGVIVLSPAVAVFSDRFTKLVSSIGLDVLYALTLGAVVVAYNLNALTTSTIFIFAALTAALAMLHKSSVGFGAVQRMSETSGVTDITAKFIAALNLPFLIGSLLSGIVYRYLGFTGCLAIGIFSFAPMPYLYWRLFRHESRVPLDRRSSFLKDLGSGFHFLKSDPLLLGTAISIGILNIASSVLPAVVGISIQIVYPGRSDLAAGAIALGVGLSILLTKRIGLLSKEWPVAYVLPISVFPATIGLLLSLKYPNPYLFTAVFVLSCFGSAARNVSSGSLRVTRVPKTMIGRVNTVYTAILYLGQSIGGFWIIKSVGNQLSSASACILLSFGVAAFFSIRLLPLGKVSSYLVKVPDAQ